MVDFGKLGYSASAVSLHYSLASVLRGEGWGEGPGRQKLRPSLET